MFAVIRNHIVLAVRDSSAGVNFSKAISIAFGTQVGYQFATAASAPTVAMWVAAVVAGLIASFVYSFIKVTRNTAETVRATRNLLAQTSA